MEKDRLYNYTAYFIVVCIVIYLFFLLNSTFKKNKIEKGDRIEKTNIEKLDYLTFSERKLKTLIDSFDIKNGEIVFIQAVLETGHFKSEIFKRNNNLFGFCYNNKYLYFKNWISCVRYYKYWQSKRYQSGDYYIFLDKVGYAQDTLYIHKLKWLIKNERKSKRNSTKRRS